MRDADGAVDTEAGVRPALVELIALRASATRQGAARRAHVGLRQQAPSPQRGQGMEYAESREYVAGDDARHIDWRVTARTGRPHTKAFQTERERLTLLVADTAPALYVGSRVRFKSVQAARAAAVAAWAAVADGDRIAALRGTHDEAPVPPASGSRGALRVLHALARWYATPPAGDAGLAVALDHAGRLLRPGARLLVLADAASIATVPAQRWQALAAHNQVLVLVLTDPLEQAPPRARLRFAASSGQVELDLRDETQHARWQAAFAEPIARAQATLRAARVRCVLLSSEMPSDVWLPAFGRPKAT
ncbi:DUF58 domain-containing protein [Luteimonas sp. gir]|uniref:DUF58 domain-containing protein n=1 Tax=Luteimonas sp. gir TaxID=3127960 RepID=UPI003075BAD4